LGTGNSATVKQSQITLRSIFLAILLIAVGFASYRLDPNGRGFLQPLHTMFSGAMIGTGLGVLIKRPLALGVLGALAMVLFILAFCDPVAKVR